MFHSIVKIHTKFGYCPGLLLQNNSVLSQMDKRKKARKKENPV